MENRCVCCWDIIPEGRWVCINCERKAIENMFQYGSFYEQKDQKEKAKHYNKR